MKEEPEKIALNKTYPPPPPKKKARKSEAEIELGIFPDIPDAQIKTELDCDGDEEGEDTSFGLIPEGMDHDNGELRKHENTDADRMAMASVTPVLHSKSEVKLKESEGLLGVQPVIKMEVFPENDLVLAKVESEDEDSSQGVPEAIKKRFGRSINSGNQSDDPRRCIYCRFSSRGGSIHEIKKNVKLHHVRYHPEHFFLEEKEQLSGLKHKQFQRILVDILFPEFIRSVGATRSCMLCGKKHKGHVWSRNEITMRRHLVLEHENELKARLNAILEDETLEEKLSRNGAEGIWCPCGMYLPKWQGMQTQHKKLYCKLIGTDESKSRKRKDNLGREADHLKPAQLPQQPVPPVLSEFEMHVVTKSEGTNSQTPLECRDPLECDDDEGTSEQHQQTSLEEEVGCEMPIHQENFSDSEPVFIIPDNVTNNEAVFNYSSDEIFMENFLPVTAKLKVYCKLCTKILFREYALDHWNHYCPKGLRRPVTSNDEVKSSSSSECTSVRKAKFNRANAEKRFQQHKKSTEISEADMFSLGCNYCRFTCRAEHSGLKKKVELQLHQLRYHPEHFFPEENRQVTGIKREQFQRILVGFLFPRFIKKDGDFRSCSLCEYQTTSWDPTNSYLKKHLIMQHKNEVKTRLNAILEDERLEGKLTSSGKAEMWCECGIYLPIGMEMHRQRYCNLIASESDIVGRRNEGSKLQDNHPNMEASPSSPMTKTNLTRLDQQEYSLSKSKCTYCSFASAAVVGKWNQNPLEAHVVRFHPEHYFPKEQAKASSLGLKLDVFQNIILNSLCSQFIRIVSGRLRLCSLCGKKYGNVRANNRDMQLRKHLIVDHNDELKEKLDSILEDVAQGSKN